ncbi:MAG: glycosyltransferase [Betaproteobacteria bacterium]|nr:glycosyltransferase [Betaproteobacteria bacterium]
MQPGVPPVAPARRARVLVLSAYPIRHPHHGGQIRVREIVQAYRAANLDVRHASVFPDHHGYRYPGIDAGDIALALAPLKQWQGHAVPFIEDLASGDVAAQRVDLLERIERDAAGPIAMLHLEQPWLLPVVLALRARGRLGPWKLCFGSQNIEHRLREAMWRAAGIPPITVAQLVDAVRALEQQAVAAADLVAAVTESDRDALQAWVPTGRNTPVVLAGNGIRPWHASPQRLQHWRERLAAQEVDARFALYVGSAHPPNVNGFGASFGASLAALPPGRSIVVAGGVGPAIEQTAWYRAHAGINASRMAVLGALADADLDALRSLAHAFIVPVTEGGGSNLKTAEALYSGCHVVATPTAMRGFESLLPWAGLHVAEPGAAFVQALRTALAQPPRDPSAADARREQLTWAHQLAPLAQAVASLAVQGGASALHP